MEKFIEVINITGKTVLIFIDKIIKIDHPDEYTNIHTMSGIIQTNIPYAEIKKRISNQP